VDRKVDRLYTPLCFYSRCCDCLLWFVDALLCVYSQGYTINKHCFDKKLINESTFASNHSNPMLICA
jgi:putative lipase involved disintegration of autophagic bodies